jgi:hypothetical protein
MSDCRPIPSVSLGFSAHESFVNFDNSAKLGFRLDQSRADFVARCFGNDSLSHARHA